MFENSCLQTWIYILHISYHYGVLVIRVTIHFYEWCQFARISFLMELFCSTFSWLIEVLLKSQWGGSLLLDWLQLLADSGSSQSLPLVMVEGRSQSTFLSITYCPDIRLEGYNLSAMGAWKVTKVRHTYTSCSGIHDTRMFVWHSNIDVTFHKNLNRK